MLEVSRFTERVTSLEQRLMRVAGEPAEVCRYLDEVIIWVEPQNCPKHF